MRIATEIDQPPLGDFGGRTVRTKKIDGNQDSNRRLCSDHALKDTLQDGFSTAAKRF